MVYLKQEILCITHETGLQLNHHILGLGLTADNFDVITSLVSIRWGACTEKSDVIVQPSSATVTLLRAQHGNIATGDNNKMAAMRYYG